MSSRSEFVDFVHTAVDAQSLEQRIHSYRLVVKQTALLEVAEHFTACADELERGLKSCEQLQLNFAAKHGGAR